VGTSTYYRMLGACTEEPVLRRITAHIRTDEVHHYQHFLETYQRHREAEGLGRLRVVRAMLNRFAMVRDLDADVASRHVLGGLPPEHPFRHVPARALAQRCSALTRQHYPFGMAARMVLKPLRLAAPLKRPLVALIAATGRWYFTHVGIQGLVQE
jgi:hypothetical protein